MSEEIEPVREQAKQAYKDSKFDLAVMLFSQCLEFDSISGSERAALLTNISLSYFKLERIEEALAAARESEVADSSWVKAKYLQGKALNHLRQFDDALAVLQRIEGGGREVEEETEFARLMRTAWSVLSAPHIASLSRPALIALNQSIRVNLAFLRDDGFAARSSRVSVRGRLGFKFSQVVHVDVGGRIRCFERDIGESVDNTQGLTKIKLCMGVSFPPNQNQTFWLEDGAEKLLSPLQAACLQATILFCNEAGAQPFNPSLAAHVISL